MKNKKYIASLTNQKHRNKIAYLFLSPWILGVILLALIPTIMCFAFSFTTIKDSVTGYVFQYSGIKNYANVLVGNAEVIPAMLQFLEIELTYVPIILIMAFIIAVVLVKDIKCKAFFRTIFFLPVIIISGTLVTLVFESDITSASNDAMAMTNPLTNSFIYRIIASYSFDLADFLINLFDQFVIILWLTGIPVILFINGLQKINKNMYEAAAIDGANKWQSLWKITIPSVLGIAFVCAIFAIVQISTLPITDLYGLITAALSRSDALALACTYAMIYVLLILLLIGIFGLILNPKEKKNEEYITYTMKKQVDKTLKNMEEK